MKVDDGFYHDCMMVSTQEEADEKFEILVQSRLCIGASRAAAELMVRQNLGYYAGYYDNETRERVERLFRCEHPYFGSIAKSGPPSQEKAFRMGFELGKKLREDVNH